MNVFENYNNLNPLNIHMFLWRKKVHLKALSSLVKEDLWSCTKLYDDILFDYQHSYQIGSLFSFNCDLTGKNNNLFLVFCREKMHLKALRSLVKEDLWSCTRLYDDILFEYPLDSFALTMSYLTGLYTGMCFFFFYIFDGFCKGVSD